MRAGAIQMSERVFCAVNKDVLEPPSYGLLDCVAEWVVARPEFNAWPSPSSSPR